MPLKTRFPSISLGVAIPFTPWQRYEEVAIKSKRPPGSHSDSSNTLNHNVLLSTLSHRLGHLNVPLQGFPDKAAEI